jgi:phosphoesterase RecJ-like protein
MSLETVCRAIKDNRVFLITSHREPEGDSLGSQLAMAEMLKTIGKRSFIVNPDKPPARYGFLEGIDSVHQPEKGRQYVFDAALVLDCPIIERTGSVAGLIAKRPIINIDHHVSNRRFGTINCVDIKASSAGEIIYGLVDKLGCRLTRRVAAYLYAAIVTDTGGFRYSNTTTKTMTIAARLIKTGIDPKQIYDSIYESFSLASRKLLALSLGTLEVSSDGKIAWMHLTRDMIKKSTATAHDAENFINYPRSINGVKIALLFSETAEGAFTKVSFRSNESWADVNRIASKFGGGGHVSASGCLVKGNIKDVQRRMLEEVKKAIR